MDPRERATAEALANRASFPEWRKRVTARALRMSVPFTVETLEGTMEGKAGDFLCLDVNGNPYPCAHDVFIKSYARVDETSAVGDTGD